ncbi:L-lactate permease [Bacillus carboniphilus]|uniref:L-lactate permease n=1 Tax=Bacillus carboniphilus TaxID=86663 RepID=A0ABY9JY21_9BACI|nr:L-lactate permease [Bacillus carboniphilus]WLR43233.1 L-lactate permease [Bacillus carboniphilus]
MLKVIFSFLPLITIILFIFIFKKSAIYTGLFVTFLTATIALLPIFNISIMDFSHPLIKAILITIIIAYILVFGILLYELMEKAGAISRIASTIASSTNDRIHQVMLLALGLSPLIESLSGFGLAVVVIAPILLALGFTPIQSSLISLTSLIIIPWGTLAMGTIIGATLGEIPLKSLGEGTSLMMIPLFIYFSILISYFAVGKKLLISRINEVIAIGLLLGIFTWFANHFISVEIAGIFSSLMIILSIFCLITFKNKRNGIYYIKDNKKDNMKTFISYISPYILLIFLLFLSRTSSSIKETLKGISNLSLQQYNIDFFLFFSPGFFLIISCIYSISFFKLSKKDILVSSKQTLQKCIPVLLATFFYIFISEMMQTAGMFTVLSILASETMGFVFLFISPLIGAMGGFLTGSNTASNTMFIRLQTETAIHIGLSPVLLATTQNVSSSLMTMVNPSRVTLGASVCKISLQENVIQKKMGLIGLGTLTIIFIELIIIYYIYNFK